MPEETNDGQETQKDIDNKVPPKENKPQTYGEENPLLERLIGERSKDSRKK